MQIECARPPDGHAQTSSVCRSPGENYEQAIECAKTFLLFHPDDEVMKDNLAFYSAMLGEDKAQAIAPRQVRAPAHLRRSEGAETLKGRASGEEDRWMKADGTRRRHRGALWRSCTRSPLPLDGVRTVPSLLVSRNGLSVMSLPEPQECGFWQLHSRWV